ncbi:MAG TPA: hypothetical protein VFF95_07915 [Candidatus Binatus sp.]|jgi:hypothetical protein|nr:hypothetical protein [Candidatus Binatus sp.]
MKPTIRAMRVREAKDFLVQHTAQQALLENVPLSDLERRMMYFTESKQALEDPATLNEEFEARYDTPEFEKKISLLMSHAYKRLRKEDAEKALQWSKAIGALRKGDHYILVLAGDSGGAVSIREWRIALAVFLPVGIVLFCIYFLPRLLPAPNPYMLRVMQALFLASVIAAVFYPRVFAPAGKLFDRCSDWIMGTDKEGDVEK